VHGPPLVGWLMVALCAAVAAFCLLRMRAASPELRRDAGGEAVMGLGMAVMAVPVTVLDPEPWATPVFATLFGALALRALLLARRGGHHLHHAVGSLAMVHMAFAPGHFGHAGHAGHAAVQPPGATALLTGLLLAYFAVYVLRTGVRIVPLRAAATTGPPAAAAAGHGWVDRPELATSCRVSMGMAMFAMLLSV
jgi:hypothetical protein